MPQPVVSSRYLFLCSPPKTVLTFSPEERATLRKLTPGSEGIAGGASFGSTFWSGAIEARSHGGRAARRTLSSDKTSADRLRDFRNTRREENKRSLPGPFRLVLEFASASSYIQ